MTTVAWDGVRLAADRQAAGNNDRVSVAKIRRLSDGRLAGAAGCWVACCQWLDWLEHGGERPKIIDDEDDSPDGIEVRPDGEIWLHERFGSFPIRDPIMAIGTGGAYARMAMHLGRPAGEAVKLAMLFDPGTGGGIDVLTL